MLEAFDDSSDLGEHMVTKDALMYCMFPTTLRGLAWEWYSRLKPLSISSFAQLAKEFELYFLANVCPKLSMMVLLRPRQMEDEPISHFVT